MDLGNQLRIHRDAFTTIASFAKYKQTPIVISEADPDGCAACAGAQNAYRNSPAYGAYEVSMMKRSLELEARLGVKLKGLVTWAFMFDDDAFFSILRTLTTNGIDKPVLNAFKLLGALNGQRLPVTSSGAHSLDDVVANGVRQAPDIDAVATIDGSKVQVLVPAGALCFAGCRSSRCVRASPQAQSHARPVVDRTSKGASPNSHLFAKLDADKIGGGCPLTQV